MKCISLKKWADYSYEDKTSLLSYWWDCFGKTIVSTNLDHDFTSSWWFDFGKSIITMEEWKTLEKTHNTDISEISILKSVYSELSFSRTSTDGDYSSELVSSLVNSYNNNIHKTKKTKNRYVLNK